MMGWQRHQLHHMKIICISLQTDNMPAAHQSLYSLDALLDAQPTVQSTEGDCTQSINEFNCFHLTAKQ